MKKLVGWILAAFGTITVIVYLTGLDDKTPLVPHRTIGWGDAGPRCTEHKCTAMDASVDICVRGDAGPVCYPKGVTECKDVVIVCPALRCQVASVVLDEDAMEACRLAGTAKKSAYSARWRACGDPEHGLPFEKLPTGTTVLGAVAEVAWQTGWQRTEVWLTQTVKAPDPKDEPEFDCVCGPGCFARGSPTPQGKPKAHVILSQWDVARDAGECRSVPCVALEGEQVDPVIGSCCKDECAGRTCGTGLCGGACGVCADGYVCVGYTCVLSPSDAGAGKGVEIGVK